MAMLLNNLDTARVLRLLNINHTESQHYMQQVATGMKINSAQDDASAYSISERMRVKVRGLSQAHGNVQNDAALLKTVQGGATNIVENLRRLKELAINAANDSNTDTDRQTIQKEFNQILDQIDDNALITFNGKYLIDGSAMKETPAVATRLSNFSLDKTTTATTKLTALKNRAGDSLTIAATDKITASYIKDGKTYTTNFTVGNNTLEDIFKNLNSIGDNVLNIGLNAPTRPSNWDLVDSFGDIQGVVLGFLQDIGLDTPVSDFWCYWLDDLFEMHDDLSYKDGSDWTASPRWNNLSDADKNYITETHSNLVRRVLARSRYAENLNEYNTALAEYKNNLAEYNMTIGADKDAGFYVTARQKGIDGQIAGITISVADNSGNVKKIANAALDNFKTNIFALNKSDGTGFNFQIGSEANQSLKFGFRDLRARALGLKGSGGNFVSLSTKENANVAIAALDNALKKSLDEVTTIGAIESRLEYTADNLTTSVENVQASESVIRDADMARTMTNYTKYNILSQTAQAMFAQANQNSNAVLDLLE